MWFKYIRQAFAFILIISGALLGVAAVYIAPSTLSFRSDEKSKLKKNGDTQNQKGIIQDPKSNDVANVQDPNDNQVNAEVHTVINQKQFGDSTVLEMLNALKNEVSYILDYTWMRMFVPDAECSNASSNYEDANSKFATISSYTTATEIPKEHTNPVSETSTIYKKLPNENLSASPVQTKPVSKKIRDICSGLKKKNNPAGQSTLLNSNMSENNKSGFVVSIRHSKGPVLRVFKKVINLLRFKNNLTRDINSTPKKSPSCLYNENGKNNDISLYF